MAKELDIPPGPGVIAFEKIRELRVGMTEAEVLEVIGPPKMRQTPESSTGPTVVFQQLGFSLFDFAADRDLDAVWVYLHDRRGKFKLTKYITTFIGFREGVTTGAWQETRDPPVSMSETDVIQVMQSFFAAMGQWEADCKADYRKEKKGELDHEVSKCNAIERLKDIFSRYCTTWEVPARNRYGGIHFSMIPTYGVDLQEIISVEIDGDRAKVTTQQTTALMDKLVYRLKRRDGQWRIEDNRQRIDIHGDETDWDL